MEKEFILGFLKGMIKPALALVAVLLALILSYLQKLGLGSEMLYSITRAFVQLSIIGFVLEFIFKQNHWWVVLVYLFMVSTASFTAGQRAKNVPRGKYVAAVSILTGTSITMCIQLVALKVFPFTPRYIIPIMGMMVGNAMTVTGVAMKRLRDDIKFQMNLVEAALALGATPRQATHQQVKRAVLLSLSPVLDCAKTVGLISLPGAMSGLILGGASPLEAIHVQMVVMNMTIGASTISSIFSTFLCWPSFFTKAYQLQTKVFAAE